MDASDEGLMLRAGAGDREAFARLYERHKAPLLQFCLQMLRNAEDAGDVFQEAFRYLYIHASTYRPTAKFTTYLYRIARNMSIDILRRRRRWNLQPLDPALDLAEPPDLREPRLESDEIEAGVRDAMEEVPPSYREVVLLRVLRGMEYAEIAEVVEAPLGTVKSRLHAGLEFLRRAMRRRKLAE
ncbi:MAG: sigma-70 family RNA polymerase sigma factor [Planctomycetes bacterium]|nr:sigma-70 family RNA polymerase sigma factor [Planctomycetota bacterium]